MKIGDIVKGRITAVTPINGQIILSVQLKDNATALLNFHEIGIEKVDATNLRVLARKYIGRKIVGKVIGTNPLTISNKQAVKELRQTNSLEVGQVFDGIVVGVSETKAKIEYNHCIITILPQEEMGIMQASNLKLLLTHGQKLRVEVIEKDGDKITVSHKRFLQDKEEWKNRIEKYQVRGQYLGIATNFIKNGVFVNLEPGIDVLCSPQPEWFDIQRGDELIIEITHINDKMKGIVIGRAFA